MNGPPACGRSKGHTEAVDWAIHNTAFRREAGRALFFSAGLRTLESHSTSTHSVSSDVCPRRCALPQAVLPTEWSPHPSPRPLGPSHTRSWRRQWHPTPVLLPGESQGRGSLVGCRLWGRPESDTTEVTAAHPLQSCPIPSSPGPVLLPYFSLGSARPSYIKYCFLKLCPKSEHAPHVHCYDPGPTSGRLSPDLLN